jgi:PIN domain nuclease of toxin-antitoxin system
VNLLLDTHVVLWAFAQPERLSARMRDLISDPRHTVAISAATVWEVEIKRRLGTLRAPDGFATECRERGFDELPIGFAHAETAGQLPRHHDDPFDRMLIAQALIEGYEIVTTDETFSRYEVALLDPT